MRAGAGCGMLWEAPQVVEGLCRAGLPSRAGMLVPVYGVTACSGCKRVGRVRSCRLHQLQGQLWVSGAGFGVRLLSFMP